MWKTLEKPYISRLSDVDYFVEYFRLINSRCEKKLIHKLLSDFPHGNVEKFNSHGINVGGYISNRYRHFGIVFKHILDFTNGA